MNTIINKTFSVNGVEFYWLENAIKEAEHLGLKKFIEHIIVYRDGLRSVPLSKDGYYFGLKIVFIGWYFQNEETKEWKRAVYNENYDKELEREEA